MTIRFEDIVEISATWFFDDKIYIYTQKPGSFSLNEKNKTLRATLIEKGKSEDEATEVNIHLADGYKYFKQTYTENPTREYPLDMYSSEDEIILHYSNLEENEIIYLHLT